MNVNLNHVDEKELHMVCKFARKPESCIEAIHANPDLIETFRNAHNNALNSPSDEMIDSNSIANKRKLLEIEGKGEEEMRKEKGEWMVKDSLNRELFQKEDHVHSDTVRKGVVVLGMDRSV